MLQLINVMCPHGEEEQVELEAETGELQEAESEVSVFMDKKGNICIINLQRLFRR